MTYELDEQTAKELGFEGAKVFFTDYDPIWEEEMATTPHIPHIDVIYNEEVHTDKDFQQMWDIICQAMLVCNRVRVIVEIVNYHTSWETGEQK